MQQKIMIIGKIKKDEETVRLNTDINCSNCGKSVPGGIRTSKKYAKTEDFIKEFKDKVIFFFSGSWHPPNLEALKFIVSNLAPINEKFIF